MKTKWFGDDRDLVKWGALLHIARARKASVIVQVCFLNAHKFPRIAIDGKSVAIPPEVIKHFRSLRSVEHLAGDVGIKVFDLPFRNRRRYLKAALEYVGQFSGQRRVVFLDPDTGLTPDKTDITHVTDAEAKGIWSALAPEDTMVLYQHQTNRGGKPWVQPKRKQFAAAIAIPVSCVKVAKGPRIARDVVFYYASKV
jgi:hypothetical protein